jgi:NAD(P)-dependent dehydrogenase (short-subunit alcohol dehydrogenase family)
MRLAGKTAVVTGASRGIGLATARALAAEGCRLALAARGLPELESAAQGLSGALPLACDVRDEASVADFFAAVRERFGRVDILVNNAGNSHALLNVEEFSLAVWRDVLDTNLTGAFLCARAALPLMSAGATIVNNLSVCAVRVFPGQAAYCAAKFGALGLTNVLREELRGRGIRVVALIAGATDTGIWEQFWAEAPRENMMSAETVAAAVVHALLLPPNSSMDEIHLNPTAGAL